ncbi:hypothetical protein FJZ31_09425 [Candidatus Poribacteria bacterium]|nr:hypothetical protein [Candidatus Poribacteria bacterium]
MESQNSSIEELEILVVSRAREIGIGVETDVIYKHDGDWLGILCIGFEYPDNPWAPGRPLIGIDRGILNPDELFGMESQLAELKLMDRIDAVLAHEYTELTLSGPNFHEAAIWGAPKTTLRISKSARDYLQSIAIGSLL